MFTFGHPPAVLLGAQWPSGCTVAEWGRGGLDWRPDGSRPGSHPAAATSLRNFGNSVYHALPVPFEDTKSRRSLLAGVYARGGKRSHQSALELCNCRGLHHPSWPDLQSASKRCPPLKKKKIIQQFSAFCPLGQNPCPCAFAVWQNPCAFTGILIRKVNYLPSINSARYTQRIILLQTVKSGWSALFSVDCSRFRPSVRTALCRPPIRQQSAPPSAELPMADADSRWAIIT